MQRHITGWFSPALDKEMEMAVYGHYGVALLLIPTAASDYLEYERNGLIDAINGGPPAPANTSHGLKVFRTVEAIAKSADTGNMVRL